MSRFAPTIRDVIVRQALVWGGGGGGGGGVGGGATLPRERNVAW